MGGIQDTEESSTGGRLNERTESPPEETKALRSAVLVVGYVFLIPSVILLLLTVLTILVNPPSSDSGDTREYLWASYATSALGMTVTLAIGLLMVRLGRKKPDCTMSDILYPSLVIIGTYILLIAVVRILSATLYTSLAIGWNPGVVISCLYQAPFIIGGLLLILIGTHRFILEA